MRGRALVLGLAALAACSRVRHVAPEGEEPAAEASEPARGVPPAPGRPRVPAAPEALLAEGAIPEIQRALARRGLLGSHRPGELDPPTSAALQSFQRGEGLAATGFPDRETLRRLGIDPEGAYGKRGDEPRP